MLTIGCRAVAAHVFLPPGAGAASEMHNNSQPAQLLQTMPRAEVWRIGGNLVVMVKEHQKARWAFQAQGADDPVTTICYRIAPIPGRVADSRGKSPLGGGFSPWKGRFRTE